MVNRGYERMPEIAASIDCLVGQSVYRTNDAARNRYHRIPATQSQQPVFSRGRR